MLIPNIEVGQKTKIIIYTSLLVSVLIAGALLPFAFAPFHFWPLAILSPAYLLWVWSHSRLDPFVCFKTKYLNSEPKRAFLTGFIYGLGLFGVGVSWVFVSIHQFGNTDAPLAVFLTFVMICLLALLTGIQGYLLKRFFKGSKTALCLLGFPCLWVFFEWFRSIYFTGFPWLFLGYTQLSTPLSGYAPICSVYAVSLAVVISSGAVVLLLTNLSSYHPYRNAQSNILANTYTNTNGNTSGNKILALIILLAIWGGGELLKHQTFTKTLPEEYTVSLVQGNVLPLDKFAQADPIQAARNVYVALTEKHWNSHLIIWPENAIAYPLPMVEPFINELKNITQANKSTLITGLQTIMQHRDYYNSMLAIGEGSGIYHKRHLVPFGDYLPFEEYLRGLIRFFDIPMSSFLAGPHQQELLKAGNLNIAPLICYEIAFPELVRETTKNANVIVTISEDGWFGNSFGPHQHFEIVRMRALETGRPLLRSTTSGISAIINSKGEVLAVSPQFQALVLKGTFQAVQAEAQTPWMKYGLLPLFILLLAGFFLPGRFGLQRFLQH